MSAEPRATRWLFASRASFAKKQAGVDTEGVVGSSREYLGVVGSSKEFIGAPLGASSKGRILPATP